MTAALEQRVIAYREEDGSLALYATAYDDAEERRQLALLRSRHGAKGEVFTDKEFKRITREERRP